MATKPEAWQEQSPVNSLNNESWTRDEVGATTSHNNPLQDSKAPRAEPEEDVDVAEPGGEDAAQQEKQAFTPDEVDHATTDCEESQRVNEAATETEQVSKERPETLDPQEEESYVQSEDVFPPPPPLSDLEKEGFPSVEREVAEWMCDAQITSGPKEDFMSPNSENSQEGPPSAGRMVNSSTEHMTQDNMAEDELNVSADGFSNSEPENHTVGTVHHPPLDSNSSDEVRVVCSPPFVDESEGEEEMNMDITSCQQQQASPDFTSQLYQPSHSASVSAPTEQDTLPLPADTSTEQQEELLTQGRRAPGPWGGNQEAAQQVHGQSAPPLSAVSIEVSNQGGAASVVAVRERHHRAGEITEGESERTGGEEGHKESALERSKGGQQQSRGLLKAEKSTCGVCFTHRRQSRMESDSCDDSQSDSGVSADFSPCSTLEGNATISTGTAPSEPRETPIEREIRRAIEREHSLRRSRGLPNPPSSPEYVDIPLRKTVLSQSLTANSERHQGKDRQFAGKKMQHDIHRETQREQDLVKLGKVPGFYDKGTVRQIKDRKQIFEVFQKPSDASFTVPDRTKVTSWSSASQNQDVSTQLSTVGASYGERRRSVDLLGPAQSNSVAKGDATNRTPRGPGFSEATGCQVIILENNMSVPALKLYRAQQEAEHVTTVDSGNPDPSSARAGRRQDKEAEVEPKENPFFKLRPSTNVGKVEQEIWEAKEREKELREQRTSVYRVEGGRGGGRPTGMEGKTTPIVSSSSPNGPAVPDSAGSSSRGGTGSTPARQSVGKLGTWPPAQAEDENIARPEIVQSPRPLRKKSPLVHRWESGLVNVSEQGY